MRTKLLRLLLSALLVAGASTSQAAECVTEAFDGARFSYCTVDLGSEELRLWRLNGNAVPYGSFDQLAAALADQGKALGVAMNGGMYHQDRAPVGLYVEEGRTDARLVTREGPGNFGLLPNGVLCLGAGRAQVTESRAFEAQGPRCAFATQSGPMLVIGGALHPRFLPDSDSLNIRNGVGVRADGREVILAISDSRVNFHHFARFFRDHLGVADALYLDGRVSKLYAPQLGRNDKGAQMGPILGTVRPAR